MKIGMRKLLIFCVVIIITILYSCSNRNEEILTTMNIRWIEKSQGKRINTTLEDSLAVDDFKLRFKAEKEDIRLVSKYHNKYEGVGYTLFLFYPIISRDIYVILCMKDKTEIGYFNYYPNSVSTIPDDIDIHPYK